MPMNPEVKAKWVEALRSGRYQQGEASLRRGLGDQVRYCCLGVLCDISGLGQWTGRAYRIETDAEAIESVHYPPLAVAEWAGTGAADPFIAGRDYLSVLNDTGKTFEEIADLIEKYL
jgi:hypothetical protein